jgi:hypothetical protein
VLGIERQYLTITLISPVDIIDQNRRRSETVIMNRSNNFQDTRCLVSDGFTVFSRRLR